MAVYGRRPDGSVHPYSVILHRTPNDWRLRGIGRMVNDLDMYKRDRVRLRQEAVVAAAAGAGAVGGGMVVVVEKVAGQQHGQHRRRHVRIAVHIGKPYTQVGYGLTVLPYRARVACA